MDGKTAAAVVPGSCPTQAGSTVDRAGLTLKGQRMQAGVNEAWILCLWLQRGAGYICVDLTQGRVCVIGKEGALIEKAPPEGLALGHFLN